MKRYFVLLILVVLAGLALSPVAAARATGNGTMTFSGAYVRQLAYVIAVESRRSGELPTAFRMPTIDNQAAEISALGAFELLARAVHEWAATKNFPKQVTISLWDLKASQADPRYESATLTKEKYAYTTDLANAQFITIIGPPRYKIPAGMTFGQTNSSAYMLSAAQIEVALAMLIDEACRAPKFPQLITIPNVRTPRNWSDMSHPFIVPPPPINSSPVPIPEVIIPLPPSLPTSVTAVYTLKVLSAEEAVAAVETAQIPVMARSTGQNAGTIFIVGDAKAVEAARQLLEQIDFQVKRASERVTLKFTTAADVYPSLTGAFPNITVTTLSQSMLQLAGPQSAVNDAKMLLAGLDQGPPEDPVFTEVVNLRWLSPERACTELASNDYGLRTASVSGPQSITLVGQGPALTQAITLLRRLDLEPAAVQLTLNGTDVYAYAVVDGQRLKPLCGTISTELTCSAPVKSVSLRMDATLLCTFKGGGKHKYAINSALFTDGPHTLMLSVTDIYGKISTIRFTIITLNGRTTSINHPQADRETQVDATPLR